MPTAAKIPPLDDDDGDEIPSTLLGAARVVFVRVQARLHNSSEDRIKVAIGELRVIAKQDSNLANTAFEYGIKRAIYAASTASRKLFHPSGPVLNSPPMEVRGTLAPESQGQPGEPDQAAARRAENKADHAAAQGRHLRRVEKAAPKVAEVLNWLEYRPPYAGGRELRNLTFAELVPIRDKFASARQVYTKFHRWFAILIDKGHKAKRFGSTVGAVLSSRAVRIAAKQAGFTGSTLPPSP